MPVKLQTITEIAADAGVSPGRIRRAAKKLDYDTSKGKLFTIPTVKAILKMMRAVAR
jgi:hypothetical protein